MSFYDKIKDQVSELRSHYSYPNDGIAFGHFILRECFNKIIGFDYDGIDYDSFIKEHLVDSSNDLGNDVIFTNQKNNEIIVFQFKYTNTQLLNIAEIKKNKKFIDWILGINAEELTPNSKLKKIIEEEIKPILSEENIDNNNFYITFYYIDNKFEGSIKDDIYGLYSNYRDKNINFQIKYYNYIELEQLYDDVKIPTNEVMLKIVPNEFFIKNIVYHDNVDTKIQTIVTSILANSLKPIIEQYKELILALNVRYYKGENEINSKIKKEYSKGNRSNFWILNNGINAVCEDFLIEDNIIKIKNFQIVNGGQTSKTLTRIVNDLSDDVQILLRLTKITDQSQITNISMDIAVSSNSQNAISSRDLHSGDRIQSTIFKKLDEVGIFYDKKDGEWATVTKRNYRNPFGNSPLYLRISNTDLGKAYLSFFLQVPTSTKGRDKLVFSEIFYDQIFSMTNNEDDQFYKLIFSYRVSEKVNRIISEKIGGYEILQNNYINDILVSLSGLYFFKMNLINASTPEKLSEELLKLDCKPYLKSNEKYLLDIDQSFDDFIFSSISNVQNILEVLKEAKEMNGSEWLQNDTSNWLKKDTTYKNIFDRVIKKLKQI